jgi:hypothetical protein
MPSRLARYCTRGQSRTNATMRTSSFCDRLSSSGRNNMNRRSGVDAAVALASGIARCRPPELGRDREFASERCEGLTDERLVGERPVALGGVEERHGSLPSPTSGEASPRASEPHMLGICRANSMHLRLLSSSSFNTASELILLVYHSGCLGLFLRTSSRTFARSRAGSGL